MMRIRRWLLALGQPWHLHVCACGESYLCTRPIGCEPYTCVDCELARMTEWVKNYEAQYPRRKGAA